MNGETLQLLAQKLQEHTDPEGARKMLELADKLNRSELQAAFCGHFSAGKSTLINRLCGHKLLPSSPIPTSANVVTIRNGEASAIVYRRNTESRSAERIPIEMLDDYAKNGEDIESIEIQYPIPLLFDHCALLDTPGIDSTDEAHMKATESALHLADIVFYVMDYNHVLSEMNFTFAKRLKEWGKPLYLIVNQIDKHKENELPFAQYAAGVADAFEQWSIAVDGILYLSLKQPDHPHQEWGKLVWLFRSLIDQREALVQWNVWRSTGQLLHSHMHFVRASHDQERELLQLQTSQEGTSDLLETYEQAVLQRDMLSGLPEKEAEAAVSRCQTILDNANIIPAATRDLAHVYVESRKPGFKLGLFGSAAKTAQESARRLEAFHLNISEQIRAHLTWHVQGELKALLERLNLPADLLQNTLAAMEQGVSADWLAGHVATGTVSSGEYTLNYSKQISAEVKAYFRRLCLDAASRIQTALQQYAMEETAKLMEQILHLELGLTAYRRLQKLERTEQEYEGELKSLLDKTPSVGASFSLPNVSKYIVTDSETQSNISGEPESLEQNALSAVALELLADRENGEGGAEEAGSYTGKVDYKRRFRETSARLLQAASLLEGLPGMNSMITSLRMKADRLENSRFTIALFGAFSAGKSSFANALIGERLLPVSPNPTTAAINTIVPPTDERMHGSAAVRLKRKEVLLEEIRYSLSVLGLPGEPIGRLNAVLSEVKPEHLSISAKPHLAFLRAVEQGWSRMEPKLGEVLLVDQHEFKRYVAEEGTSCFVDTIELHYRHPLAEQGIVLVDTPGADSINARHTGVAFNYLKNADAILFVTYYNHAFSQADREFLLQLGRVKDALELDKMFFLVNAADLAASREELEEVCRHVESNLLQHGIRFPRIYPISSTLAVQAKLENNPQQLAQSGMAAFERDFERFTWGELGGIALHRAEAELKRAAGMLDDWVRQASEGEQSRQRKLKELQGAVAAAEALLLEAQMGEKKNVQKEIDKEIDELLFYVRQRTMFRFGEFYTLAFNPSTLQEDGRDIRKTLLSCWKELLRLTAYALSQEVLATTLRVEPFIARLAVNSRVVQVVQLQMRLNYWQAPDPGDFEMTTPSVDEELEAQQIEERWLASFFKNGRYFFEGEGKSKLRAELEPVLQRSVDSFAKQQAGRLKEHYTSLFEAYESRLLIELRESVQEYASGQQQVLEMKLDLNELESKRIQLHNFIS